LKAHVESVTARNCGLLGMRAAESVVNVSGPITAVIREERRTDIVYGWNNEVAGLQLVFEFKKKQARALVTDTLSLTPAKRKRGRPATASGKATSFDPADFDAKARNRRGMSAAGRARIAAAQKARWARFKKAAK
jgi:hypothetical protein